MTIKSRCCPEGPAQTYLGLICGRHWCHYLAPGWWWLSARLCGWCCPEQTSSEAWCCGFVAPCSPVPKKRKSWCLFLSDHISSKKKNLWNITWCLSIFSGILKHVQQSKLWNQLCVFFFFFSYKLCALMSNRGHQSFMLWQDYATPVTNNTTSCWSHVLSVALFTQRAITNRRFLYYYLTSQLSVWSQKGQEHGLLLLLLCTAYARWQDLYLNVQSPWFMQRLRGWLMNGSMSLLKG